MTCIPDDTLTIASAPTVVPAVRGPLSRLVIIVPFIVACGSTDPPPRDSTVQRADRNLVCRNPALTAKFAACKQSGGTETSCKNAGGTWTSFGGDMACACPTGEIQCACSTDEECVAGCTAEPGVGKSGLTCDGVTNYQCAEWSPEQSCRCKILAAGAGIQIHCTH